MSAFLKIYAIWCVLIKLKAIDLSGQKSSPATKTGECEQVRAFSGLPQQGHPKGYFFLDGVALLAPPALSNKI
jgi:hypothetical protein